MATDLEQIVRKDSFWKIREPRGKVACFLVNDR